VILNGVVLGVWMQYDLRGKKIQGNANHSAKTMNQEKTLPLVLFF
jgi:hypothetical protein